MLINNKYNIGDTVYLKTDVDQYARMIIAILVYPNGISYEVQYCTTQSTHYEIELSETQDELLKVK